MQVVRRARPIPLRRREEARAGGGLQAEILNLQALVGNRAVAGVLGRSSGRAAPPGAGMVSVQRDPVGLAAPQQIAGFTEDASALWRAWDKLGPDQRLGELQSMVNRRFDALGVPNAKIWNTKGAAAGMGFLGGAEQGHAQFSPLTWSIDVNEGDLATGRVQSDVAGLVGSVYHEARHAEQHFLVARYLVGRHEGDKLKALHLADFVVKAAEDKPLEKKRSTKDLHELAGHLYPSIAAYGDLGTRVTEQKEKMLDANRRWRGWVRYYEASQDNRTQQNHKSLTQAKDYYLSEILVFMDLFRKYETSAVEMDAWDVGGKVTEKLGFAPRTPDDTIQVMTTEKNAVVRKFQELPPGLPPRPGEEGAV